MSEEERRQLGFIADMSAMLGQTPQGKQQPVGQALRTSGQQTKNVRGGAPAYTPPNRHGVTPAQITSIGAPWFPRKTEGREKCWPVGMPGKTYPIPTLGLTY